MVRGGRKVICGGWNQFVKDNFGDYSKWCILTLESPCNFRARIFSNYGGLASLANMTVLANQLDELFVDNLLSIQSAYEDVSSDGTMSTDMEDVNSDGTMSIDMEDVSSVDEGQESAGEDPSSVDVYSPNEESSDEDGELPSCEMRIRKYNYGQLPTKFVTAHFKEKKPFWCDIRVPDGRSWRVHFI
ncbi:putative DNA-binding pseudobarrel domain-containing protein [Rosa chinensis]|uniref:Putative DNA-binding pseudobarrel domain-containing protein n=1 Tax=Rosa chinensis TaxID=74649 RepID=A0A2P6S702_ROSCH|nr:uncharacterized protein LOC121051100 [Rosa chinensis]PRQ54462.1 putative DNA-binding pseudobarrel domain-containing protein [Rosa chinensis]